MLARSRVFCDCALRFGKIGLVFGLLEGAWGFVGHGFGPQPGFGVWVGARGFGGAGVGVGASGSAWGWSSARFGSALNSQKKLRQALFSGFL